MNQPVPPTGPTVLVAPLDWGLGHATRCIPVVHALLRHDCKVVLAASGKGKALLAQEFSDLPLLPLPGYDVHYARSPLTLPFVLAAQIPKILSAIREENRRLRDIVRDYRINAVISDNRYGLYHPSVPTVFMTHQLLIKTTLGTTADRYLQKLNYRYINSFTECWVPDDAHDDNLAGDLSHPLLEPSVPLKYIGPLSRFEPSDKAVAPKHLLVLLSGPEPQRSLFETLILDQLKEYKGPVVLVRGLPGNTDRPDVPASVTVYNHLPANELRTQILEASFVVARCGYSTVMDLAVLQKKSILVPTPGQTEQLYLARHLMKRSLALCLEQPRFRLLPALELAATFPYQTTEATGHSHLSSAIKSLCYKIEFGNFSH